MTLIIIKTLYLLLPAYLANMTPPIFNTLGWLNFLAKPIDGGKKLGNDYLFGPHKTWRGLVVAVLSGIVVAGLQSWLYNNWYFNEISLIDYQRNWLIFGLCAGSGAILGDLIKSFFKRRLHIVAGDAWPIFDQLDFILGFFLATFWLIKFDLKIFIISILLTLILHPLTNFLAYFLKIKKVWW